MQLTTDQIATIRFLTSKAMSQPEHWFDDKDIQDLKNIHEQATMAINETIHAMRKAI